VPASDPKLANIQLKHGEVPRRVATYRVCVVADEIEAAVNVGSLFRIADALGVEKLYLTGCSPVPPSTSIRKTSRATERAVPYEHCERGIEVIERLRADGYAIASLEFTTRSQDIRGFDPTRCPRLALIVGAENGGVRQELLDASDYTLHIPVCGRSSSLNVATACAVALFELTGKMDTDQRLA
jgi:tRNA G18 (ribose-2'-O)-methylase SpoU